MNDDTERTAAALRPVIARLKEIERKCASMGSRNEEFPLMEERVASIIARLEAGSEPGADPPDYAGLARELFPVTHVFESVGFMSIGKEIAHVERTLRDLAPDAEASPAQSSRDLRSTARIADEPPTAGELELEGRASEGTDDSVPVPVPVVVGLVVLVAAIALAVAIVAGVGPFKRSAAMVEPTPTAVPPTPTPPPPTPSPTAPAVDEGPNEAARLADAVAQARLAISRGELETAVTHLSAAALIDRNDDAVLEVAQNVVSLFVQSANGAAHEAQWDVAEQRLERARRTAMRFGLPTDTIDRAATLHASMERFVVVGPDQTEALRDAIGRRVDVMLSDGTVVSGSIDGIEGRELVLDIAKDVGGGLFHYDERLPLAKIEAVKIYEQ